MVQRCLFVLSDLGVAVRLLRVMQMVGKIPVGDTCPGGLYEKKIDFFLEVDLGDKFLCLCIALLICVGNLYLPTQVRLQDWEV